MNDEIDIVQNDDGSIMISVGGGSICLLSVEEAKELHKKLGNFNNLASGGLVTGAYNEVLVGEKSPGYIGLEKK